MSRSIGVGVIGASPLRPGWAVTAHLPAIASLPEYSLRAVATSSEDSARAAVEKFGVPGFANPEALIAQPDVDLVVVTVRVRDHYKLMAAALDAGKMVMCEWPLALDADQASDLAMRAVRAGVPTLIGLQARMAPAIRYARDLVSQGYVGDVLGTVFVGSGIAWGPHTDRAHAYFYDATSGATTLTVPTMHALDAMTFVLGDLAEVRAISAIRRSTVKLTDTEQDIPVTAPDHVAICGRVATGAIASVFYRGGVSRGNNLRWEINGSEGDLVLTSPIGNLQVINPTIEGARVGETEVKPLSVPPEYDLAPAAPLGPAANVARLYAAFARGLSERDSAHYAPGFAHAKYLHGWLRAIEAAAETGCSQTRAEHL